MTEHWEEIEEFPGFAISDFGRVEDLDNERFVPIRRNKQGFVMVTVNDGNRQYTRSVALLVARAFLEAPRNESYNSIIHLNGDRDDCRSLNLMWRPRWYALRYHKMFEEQPYRVAVYIRNLERFFKSLREACTTYGLVEHDTYIDMVNHEPCFHYGWIFERFEE